jgi:branched-chain amino acid transport system substrate-binding protein
MNKKLVRVLGALLTSSILAFIASPAVAQIRIGLTLSTTGPAAAIGLPSKNVAMMWPKEIAGQKIETIILDDASTPAGAVLNTRKLISEDNVDVIVGPNTTPNAIAMTDVVSDSKTPMLALAASGSIVLPMDAKKRWVFKMPQNDGLMATLVTQHMEDHGIKTLGFIGFSDGYGDSWYNELTKILDLRGIKLVAAERYNRTDTSVTAQVLKVMSAHPDAVLIAGSSTPAATPEIALVQQGYKGVIYQTHGIATFDFLKVGGKDVDGTFFPTGPAVVWEQLPKDHPSKELDVAFAKKYNAMYAPDQVTQFAADAWDAWLVLADAIPKALKLAKPGTPEFRAALRDAIESTRNLVILQGVVNMSAEDHVGLDQRSRVMARIEHGKWVYTP